MIVPSLTVIVFISVLLARMFEREGRCVRVLLIGLSTTPFVTRGGYRRRRNPRCAVAHHDGASSGGIRGRPAGLIARQEPPHRRRKGRRSGDSRPHRSP